MPLVVGGASSAARRHSLYRAEPSFLGILLRAVLRGFIASRLRTFFGRFGALLGHARLLLVDAVLAERLVPGDISRGLLPAAQQLVQE